MKDETTELIGLISAALTTLAFVPGVISVWRLRPAPAVAISTAMYIFFTIGIFGWLVYGILLKLKPIIYANAATLLLTSFILLYKYLYG